MALLSPRPVLRRRSLVALLAVAATAGPDAGDVVLIDSDEAAGPPVAVLPTARMLRWGSPMTAPWWWTCRFPSSGTGLPKMP